MILLQCDGMSSWVNGCDVCIPGKIGSLVSTVYNAILIAVPLLLIISGMFSLASAIMKQKEEDVKKAQQLLVKKLIAGAIVFLLFALVRWLVSYFDNDLTNCFDSLINYNKSSAVCEFQKDAQGNYIKDSNGNRILTEASRENGCGTATNNEFVDVNNQCKAKGADGAVKHPSNGFVCYIKDYENCSCSNGGAPFKYQDTSDVGESACNCWCAKQDWNPETGQYDYSATQGNCN